MTRQSISEEKDNASDRDGTDGTSPADQGQSQSHPGGSTKPRSAVLLLSGGMDSYTAAAVALADGFVGYVLTVSYGQRHYREIRCARQIGRKLGVAEHKFIELDLRSFGGRVHIGVSPLVRAGLGTRRGARGG